MTLSEAVRPCPVCAATHVERLHTMRFPLADGHPLPRRYDVVRCDRCGFVFADTPASQADYDRYYAEHSKYSDPRTSTGAGDQGWDDRRLEATAKTIAAAVSDPFARIVDVGCANGGLLRWLSRLGYTHLVGVDPSPACVTATRGIRGVTAHVGNVFALPAAAAGADCVILSHVLEHVRDVARAVHLVRRLCHPGGVLYVEVPDATRYAECLLAPFQDFNVEHINHFSPVSIANALAAGGFTVDSTREKTIEASPGMPYPAVGVIARAVSAPRPRFEYDVGLAPAIREYIALSRADVASLDRYLDRALRDVPEIVVWGTGQTALTLLASSRLGGARVVAFTDTNPLYHGRLLAGVPVVPPEQLTSFTAPILVGSVIHHDAIARRIDELGLPNPVVPLAPA